VTYKQFEEIPVWQSSIDLSVGVFELTDRSVFRAMGDIANQIQRAALSVSNNIAEGFERGSTADLIKFLYIARGSVGEVRSICHVMLRLRTLADYKDQITDVQKRSESIGRQLGGWLKSLKNSESSLPGQRHFTEHDRNKREQRKRADDFIAMLKENAAKNISLSKNPKDENRDV